MNAAVHLEAHAFFCQLHIWPGYLYIGKATRGLNKFQVQALNHCVADTDQSWPSISLDYLKQKKHLATNCKVGINMIMKTCKNYDLCKQYIFQTNKNKFEHFILLTYATILNTINENNEHTVTGSFYMIMSISLGLQSGNNATSLIFHK